MIRGDLGPTWHIDVAVVSLKLFCMIMFREISPLVDNLSGFVDHRVVVDSLPSVIRGLEEHIFHDMVFPNCVSSPRASVLHPAYARS